MNDTADLDNLARRLWRRVERSDDGCWIWKGSTTSGYGRIWQSAGRSPVATHRAAWMVTNGPIPDGMFVCHRCDNPPCCRPDHLFLGSPADNVADMDAKKRRRSATGERNPKTTLTDAQVAEIRSRFTRYSDATALATEYGVKPHTLYLIASGRRRTA